MESFFDGTDVGADGGTGDATIFNVGSEDFNLESLDYNNYNSGAQQDFIIVQAGAGDIPKIIKKVTKDAVKSTEKIAKSSDTIAEIIEKNKDNIASGIEWVKKEAE